MATLLSLVQQQTIKKISANNEAKYTQLATEVEDVELRDLLGTALLQDLQANPTSEANVKLLDEYEFEDCNGNTVKHKGLRYVLAYFNYAKYVGSSFIVDTFSGFKQQNTPNSDPVSEGTMKRLQTENNKIAMRSWELIKEYLDLNYTDYPLWNYTKSKNPTMPKFTFLRKTMY